MNFLLSILFSFLLHPYFVSQTNLYYDAQTQELQITSQYFLDDFEKGMASYYPNEKTMIYKSNDAALREKIKQYVLQHLQIKEDDSLCTIEFLGYEIENGDLLCYLFIKDFRVPQKTLSIRNNLLYNIKEQQTNLLNLQIGKREQTARMINPIDTHVFHF